MTENINSEENDGLTVAAYVKPRLSELGSVGELTLGADPDVAQDDGFAGVVS